MGKGPALQTLSVFGMMVLQANAGGLDVPLSGSGLLGFFCRRLGDAPLIEFHYFRVVQFFPCALFQVVVMIDVENDMCFNIPLSVVVGEVFVVFSDEAISVHYVTGV